MEINNETVTDKKVVLDHWREKFEGLYKISDVGFNEAFKIAKLAGMCNSEPWGGSVVVTDDELNIPITEYEVEKAVSKAKNGKAVGIDKIANELLHHPVIVKLLCKLFCFCLSNGKIPSTLQKIMINPIPKESGKVIDPLKYRGIPLQSCVYKILSNILNVRITRYFEKQDLLAEEQNGFRSSRSCEQHIFALTNIVHNQINCKESIYAKFIDFRKAFNFTDRNLLYYKLTQANVNGPILCLIWQMYCDIENFVRLNGVLSKPFCSNQDLKQGDNLSPSLFNFYINGLIESLNSSEAGVKIGQNKKVAVLAYADDIVIISNSAKGLQNLLDIVTEWCRNWRVCINVEKTKMMHFRKTRIKACTQKFYVNNVELAICNEYKYLGVILNCHLNLNNTIETIAKAGSQALGGLIGKTKNNIDLGFASYTKLFNTMVTPVLDYRVGAWGTGRVCKRLDQVQYRVMQYYCGAPKTTSISAMEGDFAWTPGPVRRDMATIRIYNNIIGMPSNRITRLVYELDKTNFYVGSWYANLKNICQCIGVEESLQSNSKIDIAYSRCELMSQYVHEWHNDIISKAKLHNYCTFKNAWEAEPHLRVNMSWVKRCLISRLRYGVLPLHVETGRFSQLTRHQHICKMCKNNVENEYHFLFDCDKLKTV